MNYEFENIGIKETTKIYNKFYNGYQFGTFHVDVLPDLLALTIVEEKINWAYQQKGEHVQKKR